MRGGGVQKERVTRKTGIKRQEVREETSHDLLIFLLTSLCL
jgi:hypothetical protein